MKQIKKTPFQKYLDLRDLRLESPIKFKNQIVKEYSNNTLYEILAQANGFSAVYFNQPEKMEKERKEFCPFYNACEAIVKIDPTEVLNKMDNYKDIGPFDFLIQKGARPNFAIIKFHMIFESPVAEYLAPYLDDSELTFDNFSYILNNPCDYKTSYARVIPHFLKKVHDKNLLFKILNKVLVNCYDIPDRRNVVSIFSKKGISCPKISSDALDILEKMGFKSGYGILLKNNHPNQLGKYVDNNRSVGIYFDGFCFKGFAYLTEHDSIVDEKEILPVYDIKNVEFAIEEALNSLLWI